MKNILSLLCFTFFGFVNGQIWIDQSDILINFTDFTGSGFCNTFSPGMLHTENWSVEGFSQGAVFFGGCDTINGDFTRGISMGNVSSGGVYSFQIDTNIIALGLQSTSSDFSPGAIYLRIQNLSNRVIQHLNLSYDLYINNNENRSSYWSCLIKIGAEEYIYQGLLSDSSGTTEDSFGFVKDMKFLTLSNIEFLPEEYLYIQWESGDLGGTGSRDEFAISNIQIDIPQNLPAESELMVYYPNSQQLAQIGVDISRMEGSVNFQLFDPMGEAILADTVNNQDKMEILLPDNYNFYYLMLEHNLLTRWFQLRE